MRARNAARRARRVEMQQVAWRRRQHLSERRSENHFISTISAFSRGRELRPDEADVAVLVGVLYSVE